jgi:hypothetical protein
MAAMPMGREEDRRLSVLGMKKMGLAGLALAALITMAYCLPLDHYDERTRLTVRVRARLIHADTGLPASGLVLCVGGEAVRLSDSAWRRTAYRIQAPGYSEQNSGWLTSKAECACGQSDQHGRVDTFFTPVWSRSGGRPLLWDGRIQVEPYHGISAAWVDDFASDVHWRIDFRAGEWLVDEEPEQGGTTFLLDLGTVRLPDTDGN